MGGLIVHDLRKLERTSESPNPSIMGYFCRDQIALLTCKNEYISMFTIFLQSEGILRGFLTSPLPPLGLAWLADLLLNMYT